MRRILMTMILMSLCAGCDSSGVQTSERSAYSNLKSLGAKFVIDEQGHVIEIELRGPTVGDDALTYIGQLKNLKRLNLTSARVSDAGLEKITGLSQLVEFNLNSFGNSQPVGDAGMVHLAKLTQLETLVLSNTHLTDDGLKNLQDLSSVRRLYVYGTQVTDAGLKHLHGMAQMEVFRAGATDVTEEGLLDLKEKLPNLVKFELPMLRRVDETESGHADGLPDATTNEKTVL